MGWGACISYANEPGRVFFGGSRLTIGRVGGVGVRLKCDPSNGPVMTAIESTEIKRQGLGVDHKNQ